VQSDAGVSRLAPFVASIRFAHSAGQSLADRDIVVAAGVALRSLERSLGHTLTRADGSCWRRGRAQCDGRAPTPPAWSEDMASSDARGAIAGTSIAAPRCGVWPSRRHESQEPHAGAIAEGRAFADTDSESCHPYGPPQRRGAVVTTADREVGERRPTPGTWAGDLYESDSGSMKTAFAGGSSAPT